VEIFFGIIGILLIFYWISKLDNSTVDRRVRKKEISYLDKREQSLFEAKQSYNLSSDEFQQLCHRQDLNLETIDQSIKIIRSSRL
jgi:hypothetical protein